MRLARAEGWLVGVAQVGTESDVSTLEESEGRLREYEGRLESS